MNHLGRLHHDIREGIYGFFIFLLASSSLSFGAHMNCTYEQAEEAIRIGQTLNMPSKYIAYYKKEWGFVIGEAQGKVNTPYAQFVTEGCPVSRDPSFKFDKRYIVECLKGKVSINQELCITLERKITNDAQRNPIRRKDLTLEYNGKIYEPQTVMLDQMATPYTAEDAFYFKIPTLKGNGKIKLILNDSITKKKYETVVDLSKMR